MSTKLINATKLEENLTLIADKIRSIDNSNELLEFPNDYIEKIESFYCAEDFASKTSLSGEIYGEATTCSVNHAFYEQTGITSLIFPNLTGVSEDFARGCTNCTLVRMDNLLTTTNTSFYLCKKITTFVFPKLYQLGGSLPIAGCSALTAIDFGGKSDNNTAIISNNNSFNGDTKLNTIILRSNIVWTLNWPSAFTQTPFGKDKAGGTLYVPQSLITSYEENTNWATVLAYNINNQILPIEGSQYENYYADGRAIPAV